MRPLTMRPIPILLAALLSLSPLGLRAAAATTPVPNRGGGRPGRVIGYVVLPTPIPRSPTPTPDCMKRVSYLEEHPLQGKARLGDVMLTMRYQSLVLGFHPSSSSYYVFATPSSQELDGLTVRPDMPSHLLYSDEPRHAAGDLDEFGTIVNRDFATSPASPLMGDPKITAYDPISGELFLPNETGFPLFIAPALGGVARPFAMSPAPAQIIGAAFDPEGNLYLNCGGAGDVLKVTAAEVAKGRAGQTAATTVLASFGRGSTLFGTVCDGQGHLFVVRFEAGQVWRIDTNTGLKQVWASGLCPADGLAIGIDGSLWVSQFWCSNGSKGLVNISALDGSQLGFFAIPSSVDGVSITKNSYPDDLATFGLPLPFLPPPCMIATPMPSPSFTATRSSTASPTKTPSQTSTATPTLTSTSSITLSATQTSSPTISPTHSHTPDWTATVTPTPAAPKEEECPAKIEDVVLVPNPWSVCGHQRHRCSIKLLCTVDKVEVDLYSANGSKVCSLNKAPVPLYSGDWLTLDFPEDLNLANGSYYCQVRAKKGVSQAHKTCTLVVLK